MYTACIHQVPYPYAGDVTGPLQASSVLAMVPPPPPMHGAFALGVARQYSGGSSDARPRRRRDPHIPSTRQ